MNSKEQLLKNNLIDYSKNIQIYGNLLSNIMMNLEKLSEIEKSIESNLRIINNLDTKVRSLDFINQLNNLSNISQEISKKVNSYIK